MGRICALCGKKPQFGHNVSHSKRRTNRQWKPNIIDVKLEGGKVRLCAKCNKSLSKTRKPKTSAKAEA